MLAACGDASAAEGGQYLVELFEDFLGEIGPDVVPFLQIIKRILQADA
jgi:hypothetical protein